MYLITPAQVRENTPVRGSTDSDYINPAIRRVQDLGLAYVLGNPLMVKCIGVNDGSISDESDDRYQDLIEKFIQPFLWWQTAFNLLPDISVQIGQNGVQTPDSNQGAAVFEGTMSLVRQNILSGANGYKKLLLDHLCANTSRYPEYSEYEQGEQSRTDGGQPFHGVEFY